MNKQTTDIVAYLSWPGLLIAFFIGDRYGSRFHLNQSLVIWIASTLVGFAARWLPLFGWLVGLMSGLQITAGAGEMQFPGVAGQLHIAACSGRPHRTEAAGELKLAAGGLRQDACAREILRRPPSSSSGGWLPQM